MSADTEKTSYSGFERFLYWFLIPIVFTVVLVAVLLSLLGYDISNGLLQAGNKVPVLRNVLPAPKAETTAPPDDASNGKAINSADTVQKLNATTDKLKQAEDTAAQKDQSIKDLESTVAGLEEQLKAKTQTDEQYANQIKQTASVYAKMTPSKAAPIVENLTLAERVLVLSAMKPDEQVKLLEKMDPKKAAESSIALKDVVPVKDRQVAALQERIKQLEQDSLQGTQQLSKTDLGQTFASMTPKSAAALLIQLYAASPAKVLQIMSATDNASRSKLLSAIADASKDTAAAISSKLVP